MGESNDERLANLKNIVSRYNTIDQQYIADRLSDLINSNYKDVDFYLVIGISTVSFLILSYILWNLIKIFIYRKKIQSYIILIYTMCMIWALRIFCF